mgnify:CR=1 FL=1
MKNKDFFYLQYNKINWKNQEKTKINAFINEYIIQNIVLKQKLDEIALFDIGFGIGFFIKMLIDNLKGKYQNIIIEGCEPSKVNYDYWLSLKLNEDNDKIQILTYKKPFQDVETDKKFDFITAIYVFPHFLSEDMEEIAKKIHTMLKSDGKFILILAEENYLKEKLKSEKDLFIETNNITYNGKSYKEILHYSDIPEIGKVIDYNKEESFYLDLFDDNNFKLRNKEKLNDNGFICTLFIFEKKLVGINIPGPAGQSS